MSTMPKDAIEVRTYAGLRPFADGIARGIINFMLLCGPPGTAKSRIMRDALGQNSCWIEGNATAFGIYANVTPEAREKYKRNILTQFHDDWRAIRPREFVDVLRKRFPTAYQVCEAIKADDYANLPRLMQRIESFVIIENVCQRLMEQHPEVPVITVHDAVFTTARDRELVQDVIRETFRDVLGICPMFKGEDPCPFSHLRIDSAHGSSPMLFFIPANASSLSCQNAV